MDISLSSGVVPEPSQYNVSVEMGHLTCLRIRMVDGDLRVLDGISTWLGFDSSCWSHVEVFGKLLVCVYAYLCLSIWQQWVLCVMELF